MKANITTLIKDGKPVQIETQATTGSELSSKAEIIRLVRDGVAINEVISKNTPAI